MCDIRTLRLVSVLWSFIALALFNRLVPAARGIYSTTCRVLIPMLSRSAYILFPLLEFLCGRVLGTDHDLFCMVQRVLS